jgi:hypothetical protein
MDQRTQIRCAAQQTLYNQVLQITAFIITTVLPTFIQLIRSHFVKEPYHTSILTGQGWVNELLDGHPNRIRTELGMKKDVFLALISKLHEMGHADSKYVSLEEQLAIFLYASVTGLTVRHLGERFQRSNETISKYSYSYSY